MRRLQTALMAATAALTAAGGAHAASIEFKDAAARVTVVPEDRSDIKVEIIRPNEKLPLQVRVFGDRTIVDGNLGHRIRSCHSMSDNPRVSIWGVGQVRYEDLPQVVVHTPRAVSVAAGGVVIGSVGRSESLELHDSGCNAWTVADVAGQATLHESGAGSVRMGQAGQLSAHVSGAGHLHATRVRGLEASLSGAGGVRVDELQGALEAEVSGTGSVNVTAGRASSVRAGISGIGSVVFDGVADSLDASISGMGSVRVREVTGPISKSVSGLGHVTIG